MWPMNLFRILQFSTICCYLSSESFAASCCGGGFATPSVITSDDKAQLSLSYSQSKIYADVFTNGYWKKRREKDVTELYKLEGAHIFQDLWQVGFSLPYQVRRLSGANAGSSSGLGDLSLQTGYEYLPDWDYNPYRPKGIGYLSLIVPTGKSIYESEDAQGLDARGRGFWGLGLGTTLLKKWSDWDASTHGEAHYSFSKKIHNASTEGTIHPSMGASAGLGFGLSWEAYRIGTTLDWFYEGPTDVTGTTTSSGKLKRYAASALLLSYMTDHNQSVVLSYSDQTLLGSPYNTSLSKSLTLFFQMRWER
jgi:hypothetical protein